MKTLQEYFEESLNKQTHTHVLHVRTSTVKGGGMCIYIYPDNEESDTLTLRVKTIPSSKRW